MAIVEFFIVAIVFTIIGFIWGFKFLAKILPELVIRVLIKEGYIKAKRTNEGVVLVKYNE